MDFYLLAFSIGLVSNLHCLGMCGPIAMATPYAGKNTHGKWKYALSYNAGRILTYALIGALFGAFGKGLFIAGWQQAVSIIAGIIIILMVVFPKIIYANSINQSLFFKISRIKHLFQQHLLKKNLFSAWLIGLLNGWLPCGMVYVAITGALASGDIIDGALYMIFFGLGTTPAMMSVFYISQWLQTKTKEKINKIIPVFLITLGLLFILRGMNLGIPYISPKMANSTTMKCCHK